MAHKSHRQKALQAQLDAQPAISLVSSAKRAPLPKPTPVQADSDEEDIEIEQDVAPTKSASGSTTASGSGANGGSASGFAPLSVAESSEVLKNEFRRVPIPPHRMSPLKRDWVNLYTPMVEMLGLQVRMNVKRRAVEIKVGVVLLEMS